MSEEELTRARALDHGQLCYLQLPAVDLTKSAEFYEAVFGWRVEAPYPSFEAPGLIGQWVEDRPPTRDAGPLLWLAVRDMSETLARVTANGGEVTGPPAPDGAYRILATILDPAGNPIGLAGHHFAT
jgi:predicted enzyme related to lactoylglutathione lyase